MPKTRDLTGMIFGRLTVLLRAGNIRNHAAWLCRCECGTEKIIDSGHLNSGDTKSCGCLISDTSRNLALALVLARRKPNEVIHNSDGTSTIVIVNRKGEIFHCLIDSAGYPLVKTYRWYASKCKRTCYVRGRLLSGEGPRIKIHQLLTGIKGADHRNCNGLDNRRSNLREANRTEQARNRRKCERPTSSKYTGVNWHPRVSKFYGSIRINRKLVHLGSFNSESEAARAYNEAAKLHFGEFSRLNEIPEHTAA